MKKFLAIAILLLVFTTSASAFQQRMWVMKTHNAVVIAKNTNSSSDAIDLGRRQIEGYFSIQLLIEGDGTAKVEYLLSNDGVTYVEPSGTSDITSGFTKTSGPGSDGKDMFSFAPIPARYIKIKVTETGNSSSITATVDLLIQ